MKIFKTSIIFFLIFFATNCNKQSSKKAILVIHGGAGWISKETISEELENEYKLKLRESLIAGRKILNNKGSSLDAVQESIRILEDSHLFNAGKGSVFTHDEKIEMDSSIMDGYSGEAGCVSGITTIKNPIDLAREILDNSVHVFLSGKGAEDFAIERGLVQVDESYFFTKKNYDKLIQVKMENQDIKKEKIGTVGAVAIDFQNNISAGTSTGGMTNKRYGRVGDVPIIGAGTYAENDVCGISATGHGEFFMRKM
jgi:beta-aspartyl-peptidase (threonine type)